jgi:antitoxin component YwqK of YwqJK toxin-antitoxin module
LSPAWVYGQDKKAVRHKLKSITEFEQKYEKGVAGKALKESEIRYDSNGNIIEETEYKLGKVSKHVTCQYDEDNNKIRETELDPSGKKIKVTEFKYTDDGLKSEKIVYDANNKIISKKTYKYETY